MKNITLIFILFTIISCNKISDLNSLSQNQKLNSTVDLFINEINKRKTDETDNALFINGYKENDSIYQISILNSRPIIYTDEVAKSLELGSNNSKIGYFKYKGFDCFVSSNLEELINLNYKNADNFFFKNKMKEEKEPIISDYPVMWIVLDSKNDVFKYAFPFAGTQWTEIK